MKKQILGIAGICLVLTMFSFVMACEPIGEQIKTTEQDKGTGFGEYAPYGDDAPYPDGHWGLGTDEPYKNQKGVIIE